MTADEGHRLTEQRLTALEERISETYSQAANELGETIAAYFDSFRERDEEMLELVEKGEVTLEHYKQWRLNQIARGKQYEALRDKLAERMTDTTETALSYINDTTPGIYSLNRNYAAYTIEQISDDADFTIYNEQAVKRIVKESPTLMPHYPERLALKRGIDLKYGQSQITKNVVSSILQGKGIKKMADDLQRRIADMSRASAIRTARTAITNAQNAGRQDQYTAAAAMGIKLKKRWVATLDGRTRHAHGMADGQTVDIDADFEVDGYKMAYPGDRRAPGYLLYNCRCTMRTVEPEGIEAEPRQRRVKDPETGENVLVSDMTYQEWLKWKESTKSVANTENSGIIDVDTPEKPEGSEDKSYDWLFKHANSTGVEYRGVEKRMSTATQEDIIATLSGGDETSGSCASVALAYIGQQQGYNVLDFRGGKSEDFFSSSYNLLTISRTNGLKTLRASGKSSLTVGNRLVKQCETGKEYYLAVGQHAAIVRKTNDGTLQYLEMQDSENNGWKNFDKIPRKTLSRRFGCKSTSNDSSEMFDFMIDIGESDFGTTDFRQLLGYLNTAKDSQRKGGNGTIK